MSYFPLAASARNKATLPLMPKKIPGPRRPRWMLSASGRTYTAARIAAPSSPSWHPLNYAALFPVSHEESDVPDPRPRRLDHERRPHPGIAKGQKRLQRSWPALDACSFSSCMTPQLTMNNRYISMPFHIHVFFFLSSTPAAMLDFPIGIYDTIRSSEKSASMCVIESPTFKNKLPFLRTNCAFYIGHSLTSSLQPLTQGPLVLHARTKHPASIVYPRENTPPCSPCEHKAANFFMISPPAVRSGRPAHPSLC